MKQFSSKSEFTSFVLDQVYSNIKCLCSNDSFDSFCFTLVKSSSGHVYVYAEPYEISSKSFPHVFSFCCCIVDRRSPMSIFDNIRNDIIHAVDIWLYDWFLDYDFKRALNHEA